MAAPRTDAVIRCEGNAPSSTARSICSPAPIAAPVERGTPLPNGRVRAIPATEPNALPNLGATS